ncbi:Uma2 family endonuclease, partial [Nostoc sp. HG1]|nr:Uma2 family endonuclease [Nostoc sp. HG1]
IPRFIQEAKKNGEIGTTRAFRAWVQQKISGGK